MQFPPPNVCDFVGKEKQGGEVVAEKRVERAGWSKYAARPWPPTHPPLTNAHTHRGDSDCGVCEDLRTHRRFELGGQMHTEVTFEL